MKVSDLLEEQGLEIDDVRSRCVRITDLIETHLQKILLSRVPESEREDDHPVN